MKNILLFFLIIASVESYSQTKGFELIRKINGIEIYAKQSKTKETKRKTTWIIEFIIINKTDADIFYKSRFVSPSTFDQLLGDTDKEEVNSFAVITLENAKGISFISDSDIRLRGDRTRLRTSDGATIYVLKKGKTYTRTMDFRAKNGIEPVIVVTADNSTSFTGSLYDFM